MISRPSTSDQVDYCLNIGIDIKCILCLSCYAFVFWCPLPGNNVDFGAVVWPSSLLLIRLLHLYNEVVGHYLHFELLTSVHSDRFTSKTHLLAIRKPLNHNSLPQELTHYEAANGILRRFVPVKAGSGIESSLIGYRVLGFWKFVV